MDLSLSSLQHQESDFFQPAPSNHNLAHPTLQPHRRQAGQLYPTASSLESLSISNSLLTVLPAQNQLLSHNLGAAFAPEPESYSLRQPPHPILPQPLSLDQPPVDPAAHWPTQSPQPTLHFDGSSIMDSTSWSGNNTPAHHAVGPIPMGFDWPRDQNLTASDSSSRPLSLQGTFQPTSNNQDSSTNGGANAVIHGQSSSSLSGGPGHLGAESALGGVAGGAHQSTDPLTSSLAASTLQGDLQVRTAPSTPSREDFHHPSQPHHSQQSSSQPHQQEPSAPPSQQQQQQLHVHHTHSPYHHGSLSGHELPSHEQQQLQQQPFQAQHPAYASAHYYAEQEQHDAYEHDRMHSGGLVGHPYAQSHDNLAALTPPPSAPVPQHDLPPVRARLTNTIWEDEHTFCFQVDVKGVCVARRADNNMVNGTKLLNVVGMSRGKRDGILKNEKGRVVVKVGAMHLKGVWIPLDRAMHHAKAHNIEENLYPLLVDDPTTFLYQHPHSTSVPDMRWSSQAQQQQHGYHDSDNSPKARHSDMHSSHHFNQGAHGDYYSHQHHPIFRGHGVNSPHGSPHGSNGSLSGDDDPNLVSPFEYRVQSSMASGGLIGIPSGGASSISDMRSGNHHATYYGHQSSPNQYYGAHVQQKYQDPIIHPNQHQLQLGGSLANDSPPPLSNISGHDGPQNRLQANLLPGQKRAYGPNEQTHYYPYPVHTQKSHSLSEVYPADPNTFGLASSGMNTGNFSPPVSMPSSEQHSPMSQQHQSHHSQDQHSDLQMQGAGIARHGHGGIVQQMNPPTKRPRQISRASHHSMSSSETPGSTPMNYGMAGDSNGGMYYDSLALAQQQQQKAFSTAREGDSGLVGRPRFVPGNPQAPLQYGTGSSSPQRSRSRLSSFQDPPAGGGIAQPGTVSPFGRMQNSTSPDESKQSGYMRTQSGPEGDSNVQLLKVEGVAGNFHDAAGWT